jgi:hypothetical protein
MIRFMAGIGFVKKVAHACSRKKPVLASRSLADFSAPDPVRIIGAAASIIRMPVLHWKLWELNKSGFLNEIRQCAPFTDAPPVLNFVRGKVVV